MEEAAEERKHPGKGRIAVGPGPPPVALVPLYDRPPPRHRQHPDSRSIWLREWELNFFAGKKNNYREQKLFKNILKKFKMRKSVTNLDLFSTFC